MQTLFQDVRYALRQLRKAPAFTLTAVLTLGLGLGATATMYRVVHDVLLAPLPYPAPHELVGIAFTDPMEKPNAEQNGASAEFLKEHARSFQSLGIAEDGNAGVNLSFREGNILPVQVHARRASGAYLQMFEVAPLLGHLFTSDEDVSHGPHVALLSYALWMASFHGDRSIVGRTIQLDEEPYTVVGVMPQSFRDPSTEDPTQLWEPLQLSPKDPGYDGDNYQLIGRLRLGVTPATAQAEITTLNEAFFRQSPYYRKDFNGAKQLHGYRLWPLAQVWTSNARASLLAMGGAVVAVLFIACLNLAGLVMTRGAARSQELAVRRALGASRARLLRVLLTEGMLLALFSAGIGLVTAQLLTPLLLASSPMTLPVLGASHAWQTMLFVVGVSFTSFILFSLLPAHFVIGRPAASALPGRRSTGVDRSQAGLGKLLVVAQVAIAMLLLSAASLLLGTFLKLQATSPGFEPEHLEVAQVTMRGANYESTLHKTQFIDKVIARLEQAPSVKSVAAIDGIPLDRGLNIGMLPVGHPEYARGATELRPATPAYFRTLNLSLLAGRTFTAGDDAHAPAVAVISETAARLWWPGQSPIGQRVAMQGSDPMPMQIVGIVSDTHTNSLAEPNPIMIYMPYQQMPDSLTKIINNWIATSFVMRTTNEVPVARMVEAAVHDADPSMPIAKIASMRSVIDSTTAAPQFMSWLATAFAGFALLLTVLGLFGLLSYQVAQRTRELGLRLALGATRGDLLANVMKRGLWLTGAGLTAGVVASFALPSLMAGILRDLIYTGGGPLAPVLPGSSTAVACSALAIFISAALASYLPARRAAHVQPMEALRTE